ncbi:hypothetical protein B0H17DRAFT_1173543 [Mycena rosella]|uniref:Uncharacterized protein n=1 Tax=Mycena rosella TaxID=1033263 RepID=A0AAD7MCA8_MYCRO|nr:hypothetical protein B0H17DRAFT_1173543 [Mycena rosella]
MGTECEGGQSGTAAAGMGDSAGQTSWYGSIVHRRAESVGTAPQTPLARDARSSTPLAGSTWSPTPEDLGRRMRARNEEGCSLHRPPGRIPAHKVQKKGEDEGGGWKGYGRSGVGMNQRSSLDVPAKKSARVIPDSSAVEKGDVRRGGAEYEGVPGRKRGGMIRSDESGDAGTKEGRTRKEGGSEETDDGDAHMQQSGGPCASCRVRRRLAMEIGDGGWAVGGDGESSRAATSMCDCDELRGRPRPRKERRVGPGAVHGTGSDESSEYT